MLLIKDIIGRVTTLQFLILHRPNQNENICFILKFLSRDMMMMMMMKLLLQLLSIACWSS